MKKVLFISLLVIGSLFVTSVKANALTPDIDDMAKEIIAELETEVNAEILEDEQVEFMLAQKETALSFTDELINSMPNILASEERENYFIKRLTVLRERIESYNLKPVIEYDTEEYIRIIYDFEEGNVALKLEEVLDDYSGYFNDEQVAGVYEIKNKVETGEIDNLDDLETYLDFYNSLDLPAVRTYYGDDSKSFEYRELEELEETEELEKSIQLSARTLSRTSNYVEKKYSNEVQKEFLYARQITYRKERWYNRTYVEEEKKLVIQDKTKRVAKYRTVWKTKTEWYWSGWRLKSRKVSYRTSERYYVNEIVGSEYVWKTNKVLGKYNLWTMKSESATRNLSINSVEENINNYFNTDVQLNNWIPDINRSIVDIRVYDDELLVGEALYGVFRRPIMSKEQHYRRNQYNVNLRKSNLLNYCRENELDSLDSCIDYLKIYKIINKEKIYNKIIIEGINFELANYNDSYFHQLVGKDKNYNSLNNIKLVSEKKYMEFVFDEDGYLVPDDLNIGTYNFGVGSTGYSEDYFGSYTIDHTVKDVVPYLFWGNTANDPSTIANRIFWSADGMRQKAPIVGYYGDGRHVFLPF